LIYAPIHGENSLEIEEIDSLMGFVDFGGATTAPTNPITRFTDLKTVLCAETFCID